MEQVSEFNVGNGLDKGVTHGPLIHSRAVEKVESLVQDAVSKGAKVAIGGTRLPELGHQFFAPTVLTGMTKDMDIFSEETFGPVAAIFAFSTEAEVTEMANSSEVGLAGYVFTGDIDRIFRITDSLDVGMVGANAGMISDAAAPFGGVKESGFGREGSRFGIEDYTTIRSVTFETSLEVYKV